jgi:hypothetical protein
MTYTQVWDAMRNQPHDGMIVRDEDGAFIPFDPDNMDYQDYLAWLDEGNQPTPYTQPNTTLPAPEGETDGTAPEQDRDPTLPQFPSKGGEHSRPTEPRATVIASGGGKLPASGKPGTGEYSRPAAPTQHGATGGSPKRSR